MKGASTVATVRLSIVALRRIHEVCERWERDRQTGRQRGWEEYLGQVDDAARPPLLRQLLLMEWECLQESGQAVDRDEYVARFPRYAAVVLDAWMEFEAEASPSTVSAACPAFMSAMLSAEAKQAWRGLGYEFLRHLGDGGMGAVYLANQLAADRLVAVKLMKGGPQSDRGDLCRFRREAKTLARLHHQHIVPVFEVGEFLGHSFFSMEYCSEGNLAQYLRRTRMTWLEASRLVETLARAAHVAHQADIIHRDLKPSNVLLQRAWETAELSDSATCPRIDDLTPKLADFGVAKQLSGTARTATWALVGTPEYMAPEQARGESRRVGKAADIYALGAILYECLTGRPPIQGATPLQTLARIGSPDFDLRARFGRDVPRDLQTICLHCLRPEPHLRYASAVELAEDLRRTRAGEAISIRPISKSERAWKWMRRHPAVAGMLVLLLLSGVVASGLTAWGVAASHRAKVAEAEANNLRRASLRQSANHLYRDALLFHTPKQPAATMLRMSRALGPAVAAEANDLEAAIRLQLGAWRRDVWTLENVATHKARIFGAAYSRDGKMFVTGSHDRTAQVWDATTCQPVGPPLRHRDTVFAVAFSPDGRLVATACGDGTARLWEVVTGQPVGPPLRHEDRVLAVAFSPDGEKVLTASHDRTARFWETKTGRPVGPTLRHEQIVRSVAFGLDGQKVLTGSDDHTARVWDAETGAAGLVLRHANRVFAVAFGQDGTRLATGCYDGTAQVWDANTGEPIGPAMMHRRAVMAAAFSSDGRTLLTGSDDLGVRLWDLESAEVLVEMEHLGNVRAVAFSPDGIRILTACFDGAARLWSRPSNSCLLLKDSFEITAVAFGNDVATAFSGGPGGRLQHSNSGTSEFQAPASWASSPNGRELVTGYYRGSARVWDVATRQPRGSPMICDGPVRAVAFSPEGRTVATGDKTAARCWDVATGKVIGPVLYHPSPVSAVAFRQDGKILATGSWDHCARLWDVTTGELALPPLRHVETVMSVAFSADGQRLATGSWGAVARLWNVKTGEQTSLLPHEDSVVAVAFSPDARLLLTACVDGKARLWHVETATQVGPILRHESAVQTAAFCPDGSRIMTGTRAGHSRLWNVFSAVHGTPERTCLAVEVLTGMELVESREPRPLDASAWLQRREALQRLGGSVLD